MTKDPMALQAEPPFAAATTFDLLSGFDASDPRGMEAAV